MALEDVLSGLAEGANLRGFSQENQGLYAEYLRDEDARAEGFESYAAKVAAEKAEAEKAEADAKAKQKAEAAAARKAKAAAERKAAEEAAREADSE